MRLIELKKKWEKERKELDKNMKQFDVLYMKRNREHSCISKEIFDDGRWYCDHLIGARLRKFKRDLNKEENLLHSLFYDLKAS